MSRIGRKPIPLPRGVQVAQEGQRITVTGPRGSLTREFHPRMTIQVSDGAITVARPDDTKESKALHGLTRALLANMVTGVTQGFQKRLEINGVGYRAEQQGTDILLRVGFSHPVKITPPQGIKLSTDSAGHIVTVEGNDKELVGEVAAKIRDVRKPEPYQGKGIAYVGEVIRRKAGKAGKAGGRK